MTDIIKSNDAYKKWITQIKEQYRKRQIKAASSVNREMLMFYWELGCNLEIVKAKYDWGSNFYKVISDDIKRELPDVKSFSPRILLYMHQFYRLYSLETITPQVVAQMNIFMIPWGIIDLLSTSARMIEIRQFFMLKRH